jgi:signal transduction histidine kinase
MKSPSSLRVRLLLAILLWVVLGTGAIWFSAMQLFAKHVDGQFYNELDEHVRELAGLTEIDPAGNPVLTRPLSDPRYIEPLSGFYWQIARPGFPTLKSPSMARGSLDWTIANSSRIVHRTAIGPTGQTIEYGFARPTAGGPPTHFVIATDQRLVDRATDAFKIEMTTWLTVLAMILLASGLAIVTFGIRPFNRLTLAIDRLRLGATKRIEGAFPDEIQLLVTDLNTYIDRNAEIVDRGRVQASALAHSLKTPLAIITDEAELLQKGTRPDAATVFLGQSERMQRQIDYHLARVRSGGSISGVAVQARVNAILPDLLTAMRRCHPGIEFASELPPAAWIAMDREDFSEIVTNLLDNAGKWARSKVLVSFRQDAARTRIEVTDDGPGIAPDRWETVFGIGYTCHDGSKGSGLGLAIARAVARDYGGEIMLSQAPGGGLVAALVL